MCPSALHRRRLLDRIARTIAKDTAVSERRAQVLARRLLRQIRTALRAQDATRAEALADFIAAIDTTGGVLTDPEGFTVPAADEDWIDLGEAYLKACHSLRRAPRYAA